MPACSAPSVGAPTGTSVAGYLLVAVVVVFTTRCGTSRRDRVNPLAIVLSFRTMMTKQASSQLVVRLMHAAPHNGTRVSRDCVASPHQLHPQYPDQTGPLS